MSSFQSTCIHFDPEVETAGDAVQCNAEFLAFAALKFTVLFLRRKQRTSQCLMKLGDSRRALRLQAKTSIVMKRVRLPRQNTNAFESEPRDMDECQEIWNENGNSCLN
jgi:hypothetical protein